MSQPIKSDWDLGRPDDHLRQCLAFATSKYIRLEAEVALLQSEVERLRKAGDVMDGVLGLPINDIQRQAIRDAWLAAKEVQS